MNPFTLLQEVLGGTLSFFYSLLPNYGIAIILLTVAVSLLLFPLTLKQTRSMRAMQVIQPEVKKLQKEGVPHHPLSGKIAIVRQTTLQMDAMDND